MMEKNKHSLSSALRQMPEYTPGDSLWERIAQELEQERHASTLSQAVAALPQREPSAALWDNIRTQLEKEQSFTKNDKPYFNLRALAAAILLPLAVALWFFYPRHQRKSDALHFTYHQSTEEVSNQLLQTSWNEDSEAFAEIEALLQQLPPEYISEEIAQLHKELEELNLAKAELQEAIGNFNTSPQFVAQLKKIELERTQIAKQLLRKII